MHRLVFLLLILLPGVAFAQPSFDVSCENVVQITITRIKDTYWNVESYQGHFHVLDLTLKPEAARKFVKLRMATPTICVHYRGEDCYTKDIVITANGKPLRNDAPVMTGFSDQGPAIPIIREEDAFDAARAVCPALVPEKVLTDGQVE
jgi:hypothetical protein